MAVVEAFNYQVGIEASGLEAGGRLTRRELSSIRRTFRELTEPAEEVAHRMDLVTRAFELGEVSADDYAEAIKRLEATTPEAIEERRLQSDAEREAARIKRDLMDDTERLAEKEEFLNNLVDRGTLSVEQSSREMERYRSKLLGVSVADDSVSNAEQERNQMMKRGLQITDQYENSLERYRRELEEINRIEAAGHLNPNIASRARRDIRFRQLSRVSEVAGAVPGGGAISGIAGNAASLGPALAAGVVAVGGIVVAWKAGTAAASAFASSMAEQADRMNNLALSARLLGTDTERLSAFQYAAQNRAGINTEQSIAMMEKLSAKLVEAAAGSGEAKPILEKMGLDPGTMARMDPSDALAKIADGFAAMDNPAERSQAAMKLFEEEGRRMALVMADGAKGLEDAAIRADQLGVSVSSVDAAGVNMAMDAIGDLQLAGQGFSAEIAASLAPVLTVVAQRLEPLIPLLNVTAIGIEASIPPALMLAGGLFDLTTSAYHLYQQFDAIKSLDFSRAAKEFEKMRQSASANTGMSLVSDYQAARSEAAKLAAEDQRRGQQGREDAIAIAEGAKGDRDGSDAKAAEQLIERAEQELEIRQRITELTQQIESAGTNEFNSVIRARAEAEAAGATADEVERIVNARRHLAETEATSKRNEEDAKRAEQAHEEAERAAEQRTKQLESRAESIRQAFLSPTQVLAEQFIELNELSERGLITAEEFALAREEAATSSISEQANSELSTAGAFSTEFYGQLVAQQQADREAQLERDRTRRAIEAAEAILPLDQQRFAQQQNITKEIEKQNELLRSATQIQPPAGSTAAGIPESAINAGGSSLASNQSIDLLTEILDKIDRTAEAIEAIQIETL